MTTRPESLETAIARAGSPVELMRNSSFPPFEFPVPSEFTNWRSEQAAWRETCALLDQSHHMTDVFIKGPDAARLLSDFGVNSFASFVPGMVKQYVAVNREGFFIGDAISFTSRKGSSTSSAPRRFRTGCSSRPRPAPTTWRSSATRTRRAGRGRRSCIATSSQGPTAGPGGRAADRLAAPRCRLLRDDGLQDRGPRRAGAAPRDGRPAGLRALWPVAGRPRCPGRAPRGGGRARARPRGGEGVLDRQPRVGLDPEAAVGDLRRGGEGVPRVAPGGGRGLARREHGLGRHHRLLRHPIRHRLWAARQVRPRLPRP